MSKIFYGCLKLNLNIKYSNSILHSEITEIGFKITKTGNPDNSVLLPELRSDRLKTIQTDSVSLYFSFVSLYDLFQTFSYFRLNFRKISAQAPNFSPEITIHLNLPLSSKYQFKVIGTEIFLKFPLQPLHPDKIRKKTFNKVGVLQCSYPYQCIQ